MRSRHPHVFGTAAELAEFAAETGDDVMRNWESHKRREKPSRESVLDGVPQAMPALALASKVMGKAEKIGVLQKLEQPALAMTDESELGGLLLAIVASARAAGLDPERALREATRQLSQEIRELELTAAATDGVPNLPSGESN
jgi:XTP/dITP diphosphohydrolase